MKIQSLARISFFSSIALLLSASSVGAQLLVDHQAKPRNGGMILTPSLSFSDIEYDVDGGGDVEVERSILGAALSYGVHPAFNVYGELGYIVEAEVENSRSDGDGVLLGAGLNGEFFRQGQFSGHWLAGVHYLNEDYGSGADGDVFELMLAATGRMQVIPEAGLYAGLELIPLSDGEVEARGGRGTDVDRDNPIGLRLGADYTFENGFRLNAEAAVLSEEVLLLRFSLPIT